jgi:hypothetical protein
MSGNPRRAMEVEGKMLVPCDVRRKTHEPRFDHLHDDESISSGESQTTLKKLCA